MSGRTDTEQTTSHATTDRARPFPPCGRERVAIEAVSPQLDSGRFAVKRVINEEVEVKAKVFADGHGQLVCLLCHRHQDDVDWGESAMHPLGNDRWRGAFRVERPGRYEYRVVGWVDRFLSWREELSNRNEAADISAALCAGAALVERAAKSTENAADALRRYGEALNADRPVGGRRELALSNELETLMRRCPDRRFQTLSNPVLQVVVDTERAGFSTWYELFPRSLVDGDALEHGTLRSSLARLPYISGMGFDVLYLPPVHPIGTDHRKGKNNSLSAGAEDPGSPWAIGSAAGGHKAIHPALGTFEDFRALVAGAAESGMEVALDIALQCSLDHPYVREHPEWFKHRVDGTIQHAENPPKKYEDIVPLDFECDNWRELWRELKSIFEFWIGQGVNIFRVDNPHTKPFAFWEWLIDEIKTAHPTVIFLAEAFSRPAVMHRLAKLGFTQSYTYFTWRNTKHELTEYLTELTTGESREYLRPNFWPNTPDILHEYLQLGGRPAFMCRAVLAATMCSNYGIYGPAFELLQATPREAGSEEYLDSEKYEIKKWSFSEASSIAHFIGKLNRIRRENKVLQSNWSLRFHATDNDFLIAYSKQNEDLTEMIVVVVNLDPYHAQSGNIELPVDEWGLAGDRPYQVHDLLSDARYQWHGARNYILLDPEQCPAHVFSVRRPEQEGSNFGFYT